MVEATLRWIGFALGVILAFGTVIAVMKTLIKAKVPASQMHFDQFY